MWRTERSLIWLPACHTADDLAVGPLKKAYSRFRRRGRPDKQGRVNAKGFAKALRVKDTPFLRKLLVCWSRNRVRGIFLSFEPPKPRSLLTASVALPLS